MRMLECLFFRPRRQFIDVFIDIDETLVYSEGPLKGSGLLHTYHFAHGAIEFLVALDRIPGVRISFYSCGAKLRNESLIKLVVTAIEDKGHGLNQRFQVFSVAARGYGKKRLQGLRKGIDLSRTILVDDSGMNVERGEEANLLKVYEDKRFQGKLTHAQKVYTVRVENNLVRALGIILKAIDLTKCSAGSRTEVQALQSLQWEGAMYLHDTSNAEEIYQLGLQAMQRVKPDFSLALDSTPDCYPWLSPQGDDELFPRQRNFIIQEYV